MFRSYAREGNVVTCPRGLIFPPMAMASPYANNDPPYVMTLGGGAAASRATCDSTPPCCRPVLTDSSSAGKIKGGMRFMTPGHSRGKFPWSPCLLTGNSPLHSSGHTELPPASILEPTDAALLASRTISLKNRFPWVWVCDPNLLQSVAVYFHSTPAGGRKS